MRLLFRIGTVYGFRLIELLAESGLEVSEGTIYPLLNRMGRDGTLDVKWRTDEGHGHPRKYYSLSAHASTQLPAMQHVFSKMTAALDELAKVSKVTT